MKKLFDVEPVVTELKSNEWYSPSSVIKAARAVLGSIDLDPASCWEANQTVRASRYFTKEQDGLKQPWTGHVWLNPPYSYECVAKGMETGDRPKSIMFAWINKLVSEYKSGSVSAAILLTKADPKQTWFLPLWDFLICFARDRIYFNRPGQEPERMMFGTAFVYLGPDPALFISVFRQFGRICQAIDEQEALPVTLWDHAEAS